MMERTVMITGWQAQWMERALPPLNTVSTTVIYVLSGAALLLSIRTLFRQRKCRQELAEEPSKRTTIFAAYKKEMIMANRQQYKVSIVFSVFASLIWITDAVIGGLALYNDVPSMSTSTWLEFALQMITVFAFLVFFMVAFPMLQMVGFSFWLQRRHKIIADGPSDATIAIASEASVLSIHLMQLWSFAFFALVAFWSPATPYCVIRSMLLQSVVGSVQAWSHMSFALNWRPEAANTAELMQTLSASAVAQHYCKQVKTIYVDKSDDSLLPQHEQLLAANAVSYGSR